MYIDPSLGAPLLEPLFRLQASPLYTTPFATADLGKSLKCERDMILKPLTVGSSYPNISGINWYHDQGVERWYFRLLICALLISSFS